MRSNQTARCAALVLAALLIPACGGGGGGGGGSSPTAPKPASDFKLIDKNPKSKTYRKSVSPRDYLGKVPAFYFTHAN